MKLTPCNGRRASHAPRTISAGHKTVENRDWKHLPKYRGPLLIHASKSFDREGEEWINDAFPELIIPKMYVGNGMGGIVGIVNFVGIVGEHESRWFFGPLGLVFDDARPLPFFPCKGQLGLFKVDYPDDLLFENLKGQDFERYF